MESEAVSAKKLKKAKDDPNARVTAVGLTLKEQRKKTRGLQKKYNVERERRRQLEKVAGMAERKMWN